MFFIRLDLHKKYSEYAVMDTGGKLLREGRIENTLENMKEFSESVPARSSVVICSMRGSTDFVLHEYTSCPSSDS